MNNLITNPVEQTQKHQDLKETYGFVKTEDVLNIFANKGWVVASETVANVRRTDKVGFQKHMLRLENSDFQEIPGLPNVHKSRPQLCLLNSHDGTTSFRMFLGLIRFACMNGIISGTAVNDIKLVHSKNIIKRLPDSIEHVANGIPTMIEQIQKLSGKSFSSIALQEFVKSCVDFRLQNVNKIVDVDYNSALRVFRESDSGIDAFTMMNRVQESLIRGGRVQGVRYIYEKAVKDADGKVVGHKNVSTTTRGLRSVSGQLNVNRLIYDKALELAS